MTPEPTREMPPLDPPTAAPPPTTATTFRMPPAMAYGKGALAPMFGRKVQKPGAVDAEPRHLVVRSGTARLELWHPHLLETEPENVVEAIARVLTNREWRTFLACLAAAEEDARNGMTIEGGFRFSLTRFADLLGFARVSAGDGARRISPKVRRSIKASIEALSGIGFRTVVSLAGEERVIESPRLLYRTPERVEPKKVGRLARAEEPILRITDRVLLMLKDGEGYYCSLPLAVLRTPEGVDPRVWDDCVKVLSVLYAGARVNATKTTIGGLPWRRNVLGLAFAANVVGEFDVEHLGRVRRRMGLLLRKIQEAGLLRFEMDRSAGSVQYGFSEAEHASLAAIKRPPPRRRRKK